MAKSKGRKLAELIRGGSDLATGSISGTEIANDAITSDHIGDGEVHTAALANSAVTNAKIADNAIDSEHYVDGSIDTAHIADNAVTAAKIAAGAAVPTQTGQSGKYLTTDGTNASWGTITQETASSILTKVKTVDGASSGLDADLLDGQQGSYYTGYTDTAIANLADSAPATLDTLNELAAALGDDANFSTTVTNSIATKLPKAGGTMTGAITFAAGQTFDGRDVSADGSKLDGIESGATADQIIKSATAPSSPSNGDFWYDTNDYSFYYYDGTAWQLIKNAFSASGGTVTDGGGYRYHTFTSSGTFAVTKGTNDIEYLIIGGGGGGATSYGGGGGAGGYISGTTSVSTNNYTIVVGGGGANASRASGSQYNGGNSSAFSLTATGGGAGGGDDYNGIAGGSGGGASDNNNSGGAGTSGQGFKGGNTSADGDGGAGGGGAGSAATNVNSSNRSSASAHYGGSGKTWEDGVTRASGGCGSFKDSNSIIGPVTGGGGRGGQPTAGTANTGGGGGGAYSTNSGASGGSGVVIIRYPV